MNLVASKQTKRDYKFNYTYQDYVWGWSSRFAQGCFLTGSAGVAVMLLLFTLLPPTRLFVASILSGIAFAGLGWSWALHNRVLEFDAIMLEQYEEIVHYPEQKPVENKRPFTNELVIDLNNGLGKERIYQPRPTAFRTWLKSCLENDKIQFSLRQARERGWDDDQYRILVPQLKRIGLLHKSETKNSVPVMTENGRISAQRWINGN